MSRSFHQFLNHTKPLGEIREPKAENRRFCACPGRSVRSNHNNVLNLIQISKFSNAAAEEAKNPPEEDAGEADPGAETQGDITMDNDNLDATRDNDNLDVTRDDDNLDATRDTRSRGSPTGRY